MLNLAVTTRQWNPGDDFVLKGIRNIFPQDVQWAVYNRNPDNRLSLGNHWTTHSLDIFDNVVIAGTPQWYGESVRKLFEALKDNPKPVYFLGIGVGESGVLDLSDLDLEILRMAKVVITRGDHCRDLLLDLGIAATSNVCPALFVSKHILGYYGDSFGCVLTAKHHWRLNINDDFVDRQIRLFKEFGDEVIVHHLDEIEFAKKHFSQVYYSYDPNDYEEIYDKYGFIISSRLHGAVLGLSLGKPSFLIDVDSKRCQDAASQFDPLVYCKPEEVVDRLDEPSFGNDVFAFKAKKKEEYSRLV